MNEYLLKQYEEEGNFALAFEVLKSLAKNSREYQLQPIQKKHNKSLTNCKTTEKGLTNA